MSRNWAELQRVKELRVDVGICVECGWRLAASDRLHCAACGRRIRVAKAAKRRASGIAPRVMNCGLCGKRGHERRACRVKRRKHV